MYKINNKGHIHMKKRERKKQKNNAENTLFNNCFFL